MKRVTILFALIGLISNLSEQVPRKEIRQGNRLFKAEKFAESEEAYRRAVEEDSRNTLAGFNLGDALFRLEKYEDAASQFELAASREASRENAAKALHNLGNTQLMAGNIDKSIEAYKEALRKNPGDLDTKYNLAYAMNLKKKQEQQQSQDNQDQQDQNSDQKQDQKQDPKDGKNDQQQNQQENQQPSQQNQQGESKQQPAKISKEDAKRLLEALANEEKKVQDKVKKKQAAAARTRSIKDW